MKLEHRSPHSGQGSIVYNQVIMILDFQLEVKNEDKISKYDKIYDKISISGPVFQLPMFTHSIPYWREQIFCHFPVRFPLESYSR